MDALIDSNIVIYSYLNEYHYLKEIIAAASSNISEISRVQILGYHKLSNEEERYFLEVFSFVDTILPSQEIFEKAMQLRKLYNLKLGDSIIAATALVYNLTLYTRNLSDFLKIPELECINPII